VSQHMWPKFQRNIIKSEKYMFMCSNRDYKVFVVFCHLFQSCSVKVPQTGGTGPWKMRTKSKVRMKTVHMKRKKGGVNKIVLAPKLILIVGSHPPPPPNPSPVFNFLYTVCATHIFQQIKYCQNKVLWTNTQFYSMVPRFVHFRTTDEIGVRRSNYYPKDRVIYGLPTYPTHLLTY
jgi:hypothetical protein